MSDAARLALALLVFSSPLFSLEAFAQEEDDAPIPYSDEEEEKPTDERGMRELPRVSDETPELREDTQIEADEREESLAGRDDPNIGVGGSLLLGSVLLDSAQGNFAEVKFGWGLRFTWEYGRLIPIDPWHDALFADVTWVYGAQRGGTARIFSDSHYHYFTVAPAYEYSFDAAKNYGVFAQVGGGMAYQFQAVVTDAETTTIAGVKPLLQYGAGFRARPILSTDPFVRLAIRLELTRFRRGYMDDTLIAASVGANF